jgi:hypothetical protein
MEKPVDVEKLMNFLVGQVMKKLKYEKKCADPALVRQILEELLEEESKKKNINETVDSKSTQGIIQT